ncbi:MAG: hypothetical protein WCJ18_04980, partial [Planctomycetota bacterium]
MESLEQRSMLAVTATLEGSTLHIDLSGANDAALLARNGSDYTVSGTDFYADGTFAVADVSAILVTGTADGGQAFTVATGSGIEDSLSVSAAVESTAINAEITSGASAVELLSTAITLAANVSTSGTQTYGGLVTLASSVELTATKATFAAGVAGTGNALKITGDADVQAAITGVSTFEVTGTSMLAANVSTSSTQDYGGLVTLASGVELTGSKITLDAGVTGTGNALKITGDADVQAAITGVSTFEVTGTSMLAANVSTSSTQDYGGLVTLASGVELTGSKITLDTGVAGTSNTLKIKGDADVQAAITGVSTFEVTGTSTLAANVSSSSTQDYGALVTLVNGVELTGSKITLAAGVAGTGNALKITGDADVQAAISGVSTIEVTG